MMEVLALRSGGGDASMVVTVRAIVAVLAALVIIICGSRACILQISYSRVWRNC